MSEGRLNLFQMLIRRWERCHPYNAAQALRISGSANVETWNRAWTRCMQAWGLGPAVVNGRHYRFADPRPQPEIRYLQDVRFEEHMTAELNRPFESTDLPLRPFLLESDDGDVNGDVRCFYAGVVYQHWIADSISMRMLLGDWLKRVYEPSAAREVPFRLPRYGYWTAMGPARGGWGAAEALLTLARRHTRLRQAQKVSGVGLVDHQTRFLPVPTPGGLPAALHAAARDHGVTVNDLLLAALAEACAAHVPLQRRPNRRDVAVASIVDLRPWCRDDLSETLGLYLGFTSVVCRPRDLLDFSRLLRVVGVQTRHQKRRGVAADSVMWLMAAATIGRLSRPEELYRFYRKELPLAGGLSNVHLGRGWPGAPADAKILEYLRVSPTGPMTPVVLTATTLGDRLTLGLTHRTALIPPALAQLLAKTLLDRLCNLAAFSAFQP